jgi:DNA-binding ferritin-like protein
MHADLQSATATLQYMERLLRALKLQKKATEAAEESLARVTEEAAELNKQLAQMRSLYEAGLVATQNRDDAIARLEGHMLEIWPLQKAHTALVVRHLVEAAMGRVKSRALTEAERSIAGLKKGMRAALGKLNKAREEAAEVRKESEARLEVAVALRGAKEAVVKDFLAQRRVEAELRDALERMGRLLEGERRLVAEIKAERRQAEGQHQQACEDLEAAVSKAADRYVWILALVFDLGDG